MEQTWRLVLAWAQRWRADRIEGDVTRADRPVATAAGSTRSSGSPCRWGGAFSASALGGSPGADPERLWGTADGELLVDAHEAWGSIVVRGGGGGGGALGELRGDVARLREGWSR
ncbi:hypothetical protein Krad_2628 [Kineococcus radiotolerans SRS30216 = ATCC BAA-149]|uniref:Uncharacterized protein n=1 Tax=Kineococcus radiotolerans (strain ATCC BAA-149 / DSM 14245 / SRS30216) TaxID=266940 RepID=A6WBB1_KINRD|nr:hypothetical protein Krad_2628 [Kineococcus radiotolerans SRS30216 = ATCC BAA-149]